MFQNPLLRELQAIYQQATNPQHNIFGDDTSGAWYERFHAVTALNLGPFDKKKATEVNRLILFALSCPQFPDAAITLRENPDFILSADNHQIGIELRDIYVELPKQRKMKEQELLRAQIVQHAHEIYIRLGLPAVHVSFDFNANTSFRKVDITRVAEQLVKCVPKSLANTIEFESIHSDDIGAAWLPELMAVNGCARHEYEPKESRWSASEGGSVYPAEVFFETAIMEKEMKIQSYRSSGCDELWLLIGCTRLQCVRFYARN